MRSPKVSIIFGKKFRFTVYDLKMLTDGKFTTLRSQVLRLAQKGIIHHVDTLPPQHVKVYESNVDPLVLIKQGSLAWLPPINYVPESTYLNNPFNLKNAIDMRWRTE